MPLAFLEEIKTAAGLGDFTERDILRTHRRIWVNISLLDERGKEFQLQRIPVMLPITNILVFSAHGQNPSPLVLAGSVKPKVSVIFAPFFGTRDNSGRRYTSMFSGESDPFTMKFTMQLTGASLSRIRNASSWLELER